MPSAKDLFDAIFAEAEAAMRPRPLIAVCVSVEGHIAAARLDPGPWGPDHSRFLCQHIEPGSSTFTSKNTMVVDGNGVAVHMGPADEGDSN